MNFYKRIDGAVSITVVLEKSENKFEGSSPRLRVRAPVKLFFEKMQDIFVIYMSAEKGIF